MKEPATGSYPPVVGNRNHFASVRELVDDACFRLCLQFPNLDAETIREWLTQYSEQMVRSVEWALKTGAERGIEQAAALIVNPDFYECRKRSRKVRSEHRQVQKQQEAREKAEREIAGPDEAKLVHRRLRLESDISLYRRIADQYEKELSLMAIPKNVVASKGSRVQ